jgi:hypothetical protein
MLAINMSVTLLKKFNLGYHKICLQINLINEVEDLYPENYNTEENLKKYYTNGNTSHIHCLEN